MFPICINSNKGNNWGKCDDDGTEGMGCGPQEHFRSCADVEIVAHPLLSTYVTKGSDAPRHILGWNETFKSIFYIFIDYVKHQFQLKIYNEKNNDPVGKRKSNSIYWVNFFSKDPWSGSLEKKKYQWQILGEEKIPMK